jgi:O-antigen/teichoic acid export membrane protein
LLSGGTWSFVGKVGGSIIGVVTNGLLARMLTPQEFGAYLLALSIIMFGAVVGSLGLPKTTVRLVAENMSFKQFGRTRRAIYKILGLGVLGAVGVSLAYLLVVGDLVGRYLFHSPALVAVTGLTAGWIAISVVQEITAETFRGFHDFRMATLLGGLATGGKSGGLIMRVLLLACLVVLWSASGKIDLRTVMLISIGAGITTGLLGVWLLRSKVSSLDTRGDEDAISARDVLRDAFPILLISLTSFILLTSSDLWILGAFRSQEEVAVYGAAARLVAFIAMPLLVTNLVLPPLIAEMYAQGETNKLERTVRTFSAMCGIPSLLLLAVFMLLGGQILGLVYGSYYEEGATVLMLLSIGKLVEVGSGSCGAVLQFTGHQRSMLRVNLLTSPLFIVGALLVVRDYGSIGVASMTASITVVYNVAMVLVAKKQTGIWTHVSLSSFRKTLLHR